jgi:hypothetical protein
MPSSTTMPIASAQVISGSEAIEYATTALRPMPAASASGKFATSPMMIDRTPAMSAVAAAIIVMFGSSVPPPSSWPVPSWTLPRMIGLRTMM